MAQDSDPRSGPMHPAMPTQLVDLLATGGTDGAGSAYALQQCRHGPMLFNRRDMYIGRSLAEYGEYSEAELDVLRQLLRPGAVIVEAGSNIGALTIPLARIAGESGRVYAFEPQRLLFQILCANLALNGLYNVVAQQRALGNAPGELLVPVLPPGEALNFGGVSLETHQWGEPVPVGTIDALALKRLSLVKADVEGMEQAVLEGGRETITRLRPVLYVECDRRDRSPALIELILSFGYRAFWHSPLYFNPHNFAGNGRNVFGNTASGNLLALPAERVGPISLPPVKGPDDWPAWITADGPPAPPGR
jgi:FkbM family methyltransferase